MAVAAAEAVPRPFPGPYPEGYTSVVAGGERQQKRWAQLKARLGGEETRRALEEEVGRGGLRIFDVMCRCVAVVVVVYGCVCVCV